MRKVHQINCDLYALVWCYVCVGVGVGASVHAQIHWLCQWNRTIWLKQNKVSANMYNVCVTLEKCSNLLNIILHCFVHTYIQSCVCVCALPHFWERKREEKIENTTPKKSLRIHTYSHDFYVDLFLCFRYLSTLTHTHTHANSEKNCLDYVFVFPFAVWFMKKKMVKWNRMLIVDDDPFRVTQLSTHMCRPRTV